jgi:putative DNA primase/helicase
MTEAVEFTDAHLSGLFAEEDLRGSFAWADGMGWLRYTGKRWERVDISAVMERARQWVLRHCEVAAKKAGNALATGEPADRKQAETRYKEWLGYTHVARITALVRLAKGNDHVSHNQDEFDGDPFMLNCQNGMVDLRTGEMREHSPSDLVTKITEVDYRPGAIHDDWTSALDAVPEDVRPWYQLRLGQAVTGEMTPDDLMLIQQGGGANGKSTIMGAIQETLGGYFLMVAQRALLAGGDAVPTELFDFKGARFASLEELPEDRLLPTEKLKALVGTPTITARQMRENDITFKATHTLFVSTNYAPSVTETDAGTWRRLALVRFPYHYVKHPWEVVSQNDRLGDPTIRERLRQGVAQREAVLSWLIEGAIRYYQDFDAFVILPDRVEKDTLAWRKVSDLVLGYIEERINFAPDSAILVTELLEDFNTWLSAGNQRPWSSKKFHSRFSDHERVSALGVTSGVSKNRNELSRRSGMVKPLTVDTFRVWFGVAFKPLTDDPEYWAAVKQAAEWNEAVNPTRHDGDGSQSGLHELHLSW